MQLNGPTFVPKAVLTAGRIAHQPFEVPTEMTKSALLQGGVIHELVGAANKTAADAVKALEPRGPAKLLEKLFGKVDGALVHSTGQAKTATEVFWVPFSNGAHQVGHAVANPFSLFYAKRAGFEVPEDPAATQAMLASITDPDPESTKFPGFTWPVPAPPAEEPPPADKPAEEPPPADKPAEEPPPADKPAEEPPPADKPAEEAPVEEKPAEEKPAEDKPAEEQPAEVSATEGQPTEGQPTEGQPTEGQPTEGQPAEGETRSVAPPDVDAAATTDPAAATAGAVDGATGVATDATTTAPTQDAATGAEVTATS